MAELFLKSITSNSSVTVSSDKKTVSSKLPSDKAVDAFFESVLNSDVFKKRLVEKPNDVSIESLIADAICDTKSAFLGGSLNVSKTWSLKELIDTIGSKFMISDANVTKGSTTFDNDSLLKFMKAVLFKAGLSIEVKFPDNIVETLKIVALKCNTQNQEADQFIEDILTECNGTPTEPLTKWSSIYEEMKKFHYGNGTNGLFYEGDGKVVDFMQNVTSIDVKFLKNIFLSSTAFTSDEQFTNILDEKASSATGSDNVEVLISFINSVLTHTESNLKAQSYQTMDVAKDDFKSKIKIEIPVVFTETDFKDKIVAPFEQVDSNFKWSACPVKLSSPEFETYVNAVAKKCCEAFATAAGTVKSIKAKFIELFFSKEELDKFAASIKSTGDDSKVNNTSDDNEHEQSVVPHKTKSGFFKKHWWWIVFPGLGVAIIFVLGILIVIKRRNNSETQQAV